MTHTNRLRAFLRTMKPALVEEGPAVVPAMDDSHPAWAPVWNHLAGIPLNKGLPDPRGGHARHHDHDQDPATEFGRSAGDGLMRCTVEDCAEDGYPRYDRHSNYSGRACEGHVNRLPGQGEMWDYEAEEDIEPEVER